MRTAKKTKRCQKLSFSRELNFGTTYNDKLNNMRTKRKYFVVWNRTFDLSLPSSTTILLTSWMKGTTIITPAATTVLTLTNMIQLFTPGW